MKNRLRQSGDWIYGTKIDKKAQDSVKKCKKPLVFLTG